MKTKNLKQGQTYETATGKIEYTLQSDMMFHYVMQKSKGALTGLVCALKGITPSEVKDIHVENPIDLNNAARETIMDIKLTLNNNEIMNIELQMYFEEQWIQRSILYLCRAYDSIDRGDNYTQLKPTTLYCITDKNLLSDASPEFYSKYQLLNVKNHNLYSDIIGINVLQLNHTELATKEDISNNLLYWANLFKATTWEDFKALAKDNPAIEEVGTMIFELNYDNQAKELLEGQRRYREQMATQYASGVIDAKKELQPIIDDLEEKIENSEHEKSELKDEVSRLQALLKEHGISDK
ncbi:PD-(D/E)XK nuclease family transposase [Butyrivibrio sp. LB2008]|uniref:PD-(D/E)XK nuclease family transposase n=1 Tax=Butyrivibrio sp. LB2008 TaxID=1408305 RepID=UPI000562C31D|nr:PD-(D/E)XK nuclease family transposase [Butyrivibrio sp. LB2008]